MLSPMLARRKIKPTQVSASLVFFTIQFYAANEIPHLLVFLDSTYTVFTHFLMQISPLKQLWGGKSITLTLQWQGCTLLLFRSKFLLVLLCLRSNNTLEKQGTAALSSLAHMATYNIHDHAVYFHINKAHPFKLGCEFNLETGLSAISPHYLGEEKKKTAYATTACSLFLLYLIHVWHIFPFGCWGVPKMLKQ